MASRRVLYLNHDNPEPSGGVKVMYAHVQTLRRNGIDAIMVHGRRGFRPDWFPGDVPILYAEGGLQLRPDDLVIIPEDHTAVLARAPSMPVQKIILCQNHYYVFEGLGAARSWQDLGISAVLAVSEPIAEFVKKFMGFNDVPIIHGTVDHSLFAPREKKLQIACMPRKRPDEFRFVRALADRLIPSAVPWIEIAGQTEPHVAATLGESAVFLSMSLLEGLGLPPLEAMSCSCAVVGFHGGGGEEYARPDNGFWVPDDDLVGCAQMLANVVNRLVTNDSSVHAIISAGRQTALQYTTERQERELVAAIGKLLAQ